MIPTLSTARLKLRAPVSADAQAISRLSGDPSVARMVSQVPSPNPSIAVEGWLEVLAARQASDRVAEDGALRDMVWAIVPRGEAELVGLVGLHRRGEVAELGYWVGRDHWGQGVASEAGAAVMGWADSPASRRLFSGRVMRWKARHFVDNPRSGRVLEKLGFRATGEEVSMFSVGRGGKAPARLLERALAGQVGIH
jgi:RimJ/RimL family protein N-acetyltransferase